MQRVAPNFFKGCIFVIFLSSDEAVALVERIIETYSGSIRPSVTKRTKYIIADQEAYATNQVEWDKATAQDTPILSTAWLVECIKQKQLVEPDADWEIEKPEPAPTAPKVTAKRKQPDDVDADEDAAPPPKKAKTDPATAPGPAAFLPPHAALKPKTCWMGVCSYESDKYPFTLTLVTVMGNAVEGTIDWPTLNNAKTKFKGTISGTNIRFEEYEAIQGGEDVVLPASYKGQLDPTSADSITGIVNEGTEDAGKFTVTYVEQDEDEDAMDTDEPSLIVGAIKPNQKYSGVVIQQHPFELTITSRAGNKLEGTIHWKSLKCTTKFRGTEDTEKEELHIEEYEIADIKAGSIEPELPMRYKASLAADLKHLEGSWGTDIQEPEGTFNINLWHD